ncbi:hypothetical protein PPSIR1_24314 [Plesiocystis pacifica SIR-1]|uniref:Knr4/Smi1-like domain-containing protein n=1 Tax=Plesiocystis pacifica SIR-1 TaxID=391625 RepID=A6GC27_9BACT|nr:hypothetical protein [Plesiocystis pacifica]EDM76589.1 hypothetical protein PPSIR1_24314 [Plesiocystis pacifica SIR-1]
MNDINAYLERVFAPHAVPAAIARAAVFAFVDDDRIYPFDDCNFAEPGEDSLETWAGTPESAAAMREQLFIWLQGSSGCLYGFWSHDGRPMLDAPIVYLDDEGDGNGVIANGLDEFLAIAAHGFSRITPRGFEPELDELEGEAAEAFFTARGIEPAPDPARVVQAARAAHPDFDAWLGAKLG